METYDIRHLTFAYPNGSGAALQDVSFSVSPGEFITLCGPSGCGKTTLLRQLKPALTPHGARSGEVLFCGTPLVELTARQQAEQIGFVLQHPENQVVTDKVWHELAFGLESLGYENAVIRRRVAEMADFFGIESWFHQDVAQLSGGQKQLLSLAAVMTLQPSVLLLDEPTSQLDPIAASEFLTVLGKINRQLGVTVILSEHRLEEALPLSSRMICMDSGRIIADGTPQQAGALLKKLQHPMFCAMPTPMQVWGAVKEDGSACPVTVEEGRRWLQSKPLQAVVPPPQPVQGSEVLQCREVSFRFEREGKDVLRHLDLTLHRGQIYALLGGNGAGKSTLLNLLAGIYAPVEGEITGQDRGGIGLLPQDPKTVFVKKTVLEDLQDQLRLEDGDAALLEKVTALCRIEHLLQRHPYDLSGGEQQRAALAKVLLRRPSVLLLDEPTKGMDAAFQREFAALLETLAAAGTAVLMVSHDLNFCARCSHRCGLLFDGSIAAEDMPRAFFSGNRFYTTAAARMASGIVPDAVTAEDLIAATGGALPRIHRQPALYAPPCTAPAKALAPAAKKPLNWRTAVSAALLLLCIPMTIWLGVQVLADRKYYFISALVLLEAMAAFVLLFEGRKPKPRELMVVAVLCAAGVAGRLVFFFLPQIKPVAALVILAGAALGWQTGFLTGAVTMLVSNFYFGQGPMTPWQMFAMGLVGLFAGVLFHRKGKQPKLSLLCIYGFSAVVLLYGGLMNPAAVITVQNNITWPMLISAWGLGLPMDLLYAAATVLFLLLGARPILEKLQRVKDKYGLE